MNPVLKFLAAYGAIVGLAWLIFQVLEIAK